MGPPPMVPKLPASEKSPFGTEIGAARSDPGFRARRLVDDRLLALAANDFLNDDPVCSRGYRCAGEYTHAGPAFDLLPKNSARQGLPDHRESRRQGAEVGVAHCIAVHCRHVRPRRVDRRGHRCRKDAAGSRGKGDPFAAQGLSFCKNEGESFVKADHGKRCSSGYSLRQLRRDGLLLRRLELSPDRMKRILKAEAEVNEWRGLSVVPRR